MMNGERKGGEIALPDRIERLSPPSGHDIGDPVDRNGPFVIVRMAVDHEVDPILLKEGNPVFLHGGISAVFSAAEGGMVKINHLPPGRRFERVDQPLFLLCIVHMIAVEADEMNIAPEEIAIKDPLRKIKVISERSSLVRHHIVIPGNGEERKMVDDS